VELQETAVHLQRLLRLERDHELRGGGEKDKVLFHWRRASACVLADDLAFKGNKENMEESNIELLRSCHAWVMHAGHDLGSDLI
jgi:hypothetical protein